MPETTQGPPIHGDEDPAKYRAKCWLRDAEKRLRHIDDQAELGKLWQTVASRMRADEPMVLLTSERFEQIRRLLTRAEALLDGTSTGEITWDDLAVAWLDSYAPLKPSLQLAAPSEDKDEAAAE